MWSELLSAYNSTRALLAWKVRVAPRSRGRIQVCMYVHRSSVKGTGSRMFSQEVLVHTTLVVEMEVGVYFTVRQSGDRIAKQPPLYDRRCVLLLAGLISWIQRRN